MTLCLCGCGREITVQYHHKWKPSKYILGHNPSWNKGTKGKGVCKPNSGGFKKEQIPWNKGMVYPEVLRRKMSERAREFFKNPENKKKYSGKNNPNWGKQPSDERKRKQSEALKGTRRGEQNPMWMRRGEQNPRWNGGKQLAKARCRRRRRECGFILLTKINPYNEPIEYHHIHPDLPYVIPCPTRIHQTFKGKTHYQNVNAMLGFRFDKD